MTFDDITGDRKLWAVHFEGEDDNEFYKVFNNWTDVVWLRAFFKENIDDLNAYFKITDILVMAPPIRYQIDSRQLHHYRRRHQADGYDAGKRTHQAGTCENRQGSTLLA